MTPVQALAIYLDVQPATVRRWILRGHIALRPGGTLDPDTLKRWLTSRNERMIRHKVASAA